MPARKITTWSLTALLLTATGGWFLQGARAQRQIPRTRTATGGGSILASNCRVKLLKHVNLGFDRVGTIKILKLREGDMVKGGELIAQLDESVARAALATAVEKAQNKIHERYAVKSLDVAENELQQAVEANRRAKMDVVPDIEVRRLRLAKERSALQIEQAQHDRVIAGLDRDLAQAELKTFFLSAPFDGMVSRRLKYAGEAVRQGDPVIELVSIEKMKVEGRVKLEDAIRIRRGQSVTVKLANPEDGSSRLPAAFLRATFRGRIVYIDPGASPVGERDVRVWAEVENHDGLLRHGLNATMIIDRATGGKPSKASR